MAWRLGGWVYEKLDQLFCDEPEHMDGKRFTMYLGCFSFNVLLGMLVASRGESARDRALANGSESQLFTIIRIIVEQTQHTQDCGCRVNNCRRLALIHFEKEI